MRKKRIPERDDLNEIIDYILSDKETHLSEQLKEYLEKVDVADNLIRKYKIKKKVVNGLIKRFGIGSRYAYRLINDAQLVYASVHTASKDYWKEVIREMALKTYQKAVKAKDFTAQNAAIKNLIQIIGLDKEDSGFDPTKIDIHTYILGFIPETLNVPLPANYQERLKEMKQKKLKALEDIQDVEPIE